MVQLLMGKVPTSSGTAEPGPEIWAWAGEGLNGASPVNGKNGIHFLKAAFVSEAMAAASQ